MPRGLNVYNNAALQGRLWTPALERVRVRAWYDASDFSTLSVASGAATQWRDKSAYGNHLAPSNTGPAFSPTGLRGGPALTWDGLTGTSAKGLTRASSVTGFAASDVITVHGVAQCNSTPSTNAVSIIHFNLATITADDWAQTTIVGTQLDRQGTNSAITTYIDPTGDLSITPISLNTPFVFSQKVTATTWQNGVNGTLTAASAITLPTGGTVGRIAVGYPVQDGAPSSYRSWTGPIPELIVWAGVIADYQRQRNEGYLAWKWKHLGLLDMLSGVHPFKNRPPLIGD